MNPDAEHRVVGYFAICPTMVVRDDMPKPLQRGALRAAPAWLLAKLAQDGSLRGAKNHQWAAELLREALETILGWYSRHGFQSTGSHDLRLYMKVATARKYLAQE